jgi:2-amino-4-hydroxy-6-hydroxymethyldihydropteridine diphosphokinase
VAEPATAPRWLLVLGSNRDNADALLDRATQEIHALGTIERCSSRIDGDDIAGRGPRYLNQVLLLRADCAGEMLRDHLKRIEQALGRDAARLQAGLCDIDIDLLARIDGDAIEWLADKPLRVPAVATVLREWDIQPR